MASPSCLRLLEHLARAAASRTFCTAGRSRPIRIAMMAITTRSSISVNPGRSRRYPTELRVHLMTTPGEMGAGRKVPPPRILPLGLPCQGISAHLRTPRGLPGRGDGADAEGAVLGTDAPAG